MSSCFNGKKEEWLEYVAKFKAFLAMKRCTGGIQTILNQNACYGGKELDATTELRKAKKLVKMKNAMVMAYMAQCLSGMTMLNAIFHVQAEISWPTGKACQLFDKLKQKYNPNSC